MEISLFSSYHPHAKYTLNQPPYSLYTKNNPLVQFGGGSFADDIKVSTSLGTEAIIKIPVSITQAYATLALHENNRFEV